MPGEALGPIDLALVADALLALAGEDTAAPYRTEDREIARELRHSRRRDLRGDDALVELASRAAGPTFAAECAAIADGARLTARQRRTFDLRLAGLTFDEIGRALHITKQGASSVFVQCMAKVGRAVRGYPYLGLSDCYSEDLARSGAARRRR